MIGAGIGCDTSAPFVHLGPRRAMSAPITRGSSPNAYVPRPSPTDFRPLTSMAPPVKYATEEEKREARIASKKRYYQRRVSILSAGDHAAHRTWRCRHKESEQEKARLRWRARKQRERGDPTGSLCGSPVRGTVVRARRSTNCRLRDLLRRPTCTPPGHLPLRHLPRRPAARWSLRDHHDPSVIMYAVRSVRVYRPADPTSQPRISSPKSAAGHLPRNAARSPSPPPTVSPHASGSTSPF